MYDFYIVYINIKNININSRAPKQTEPKLKPASTLSPLGSSMDPIVSVSTLSLCVAGKSQRSPPVKRDSPHSAIVHLQLGVRSHWFIYKRRADQKLEWRRSTLTHSWTGYQNIEEKLGLKHKGGV